MGFQLPTFNLTANRWFNGALVTNPPSSSFPCNLSRGERTAVPYLDPGTGAFPGALMMLLFPKHTDVLGIYAGSFEDLLEVPAGSGRYYVVYDVDDAGKGFPNEHRWAWIFKYTSTFGAFWGNPWGATDWPVPYP